MGRPMWVGLGGGIMMWHAQGTLGVTFQEGPWSHSTLYWSLLKVLGTLPTGRDRKEVPSAGCPLCVPLGKLLNPTPRAVSSWNPLRFPLLVSRCQGLLPYCGDICINTHTHHIGHTQTHHKPPKLLQLL